uniref:Major facilitator superfamily (MFS) profile domain-containing protein n=1 Tax=Chromera velia CCMP2878 TaxID=1169474 RepID=A0A0G4I1P9_9ALVE|eukprot:Cvel_1666.t1-p1 / transcript=Cvel_1666.t1 / gene=Cvel_1666 / organism=Chromera_velia_CCMP2878 / gene_product=Dipeptide and tripeptide permease A, putative / transcript_product=Dipeptide and tripeptide permease A, putative / location=Cvel_scaffold60:14282-18726(-) / protein_length=514 / sequence_SO=supercontig / SO=protein_coding / is_pseudo=false
MPPSLQRRDTSVFDSFPWPDGPREISLFFVIALLDSYAGFTLDYIFVKFLEDTEHLSDFSTGWYFSVFGVAVLLFGFILAPWIDGLGVRQSLLLAAAVSSVGYLTLATVIHEAFFYTTLLLLIPIGQAVGTAARLIAVKRYTSDANRTFVFALYYVVVNIGSLLASVAVHLSKVNRHQLSSTGLPGGCNQFYREILLFSSLCELVMFPLAWTLREVKVGDADGKIYPFEPKAADVTGTFARIIGSPGYGRFLLLAGVFSLGVGATMRHLGSTFVIFYTRAFGSRAPYELIMAINPSILIFWTPLIGLYESRFHVSLYPAMLVGSLLSALCPLPLLIYPSMQASVVMFVIFTLGEGVWSPRLKEYSMVAPPEGHEAIYAAVDAAPKYVARFAAGGTSAILTTWLLPPDGQQRPRLLWLFILLGGLITPLVVFLLRSQLLSPKQAQPTFTPGHSQQMLLEGEGEEDPLGEGEEEEGECSPDRRKSHGGSLTAEGDGERMVERGVGSSPGVYGTGGT